MQELSLMEMLKSGIHFGHQKKRWHPKMEQYIYAMRSGIHIIDLEKTAAKLTEAADFLKQTVAKGGTVLFVSTKRQAQGIVKKEAESVGMPFVTERWIGGTLTNFENIHKLAQRLKDLRSKRESGELEKYTKLEQLKFDEEISNLETAIGGIQDMDKKPNAIVIIDIKKEKTALREAHKTNIPVVAITDTNTNPTLVEYPIPANDDATKAIEFLASYLAAAVREGQHQQQKAAPQAAEKKETADEQTKQEA